MNERIKLQISEYGDIQGAISRLEESTAGCPDVCILICEELLDHLLKSGYRKIGMTVKGRKMRVIEIRAETLCTLHLRRTIRTALHPK